jgi:hypothetical protein
MENVRATAKYGVMGGMNPPRASRPRGPRPAALLVLLACARMILAPPRFRSCRAKADDDVRAVASFPVSATNV